MSEEPKVDRSKIIDKIKKCLALSKSANEHEAAAALRQAQKLMKHYKIDECEVEGEIMVNQFLDTREKFSMDKPDSLRSITQLMMQAFGVMVTWTRSPASRHRITYWGTQAQVMIAIHAHKMVYKAANESWDDFSREHGFSLPRSAKGSFVLGWCHVVQKKVEDLAPRGDRYERMKKSAETAMGKTISPLKNRTEEDFLKKVHLPSAHAGIAAGQDFNLHIPVTQKET